MTTSSDAPRQTFERQTHVDLGALSQRVTGTEKAIGDMSAAIASLRQETATQINSVAENLSRQIGDVGKAVSEQGRSFSASRSTNWTTFAGAAAGVIGVMVAIGSQALSPIYGTQGRHEDEIREIYRTSVTKDAEQQDVQRAILRMNKIDDRIDTKVGRNEYDELKDRLNERYAITHEQTLRDVTRLDKSIDQVDANLIKRPEIQALVDNLGNRIDALSRNAEDLRRDFGSNYTVGDQLKSLQRQIETLQGQVRATPASGQNAP